MHNKDIGTLGELIVCTYLHENGYGVYRPVGDNTRVDVIAETPNGKLVKIQVKASPRQKDKPNCSLLYVRKSGPNGYKFTYTKEQLDYFAMVDIITKKIAWIPNTILGVDIL